MATQPLSTKMDLKGFVFFCLVMLVPLSLWFVVKNPIPRSLLAVGQSVCRGVPAPGTAQFDSTASRTHPIVIMWDSVNSIRKREYPTGWLPSADSATELVACVFVYFNVVDYCRYDIGPRRELRRATMVTQVYEARSARMVTALSLQGGDPGPCPQRVTRRPMSGLDRQDGSVPGRRDLTGQEDFRRLVEGQSAGDSGLKPPTRAP